MSSMPNVFLGFRIKNPEILKAAEEVQQDIIDHEDELEDSLVPTVKLHVTLLVFRAEEDQLELAKTVIQNVFEKIKNNLIQDPLILNFRGVDSFPGDKVVFAVPQVDSQVLGRLNDLRARFVAALDQEKFDIPQHQRDNTIKPHLTLVKILRRSQLNSIPQNSFKHNKHKIFGAEKMGALQFLSMAKPVMEDGYYYIEQEYPLEC